jgi:hypothetical protein
VGRPGLLTGKVDIYYRAPTNSVVGPAYVYCDDEDDIVLTGYCNALNGAIKGQGAVWLSDLSQKSGWYCDAGTNNALTIMVACIKVP